MPSIIDLRSDTVTRPSETMRRAMAAAEVGDDVYGEDPTVNRLEARAAEIFGREAGLFVPTGTMGNQIAVRMHTQHGEEVICESRGHLVDWEMAMVSAFSGCQLRTVYADRGILTWPLIRKVIFDGSHFGARTGLISIENTHNLAGGTVMPREIAEEILAGAAEHGLPVHLDGARIFNAATALDIPVDRLTSGFSSVMFCLSKGLCAPVGSMLVSSRENIDRARNFRKALPLVDLVLVIYPRSPDDVKQRAMLRYSLGQASSAAEDLEQYLKMSPDASDADEIRQTALSIRRMLALMN